jgi:hypothetical protein
MNDLVKFTYEGRKVRTFIKDGEPWWVGKDVAEVLGYSEESNPARLFSNVPEEWKGVKPIHTLGGIQDMLCLSEQGLYFFMGRSDKPAALPFQKWIAGEVIPAIRKRGFYAEKDAVIGEDFSPNLAKSIGVRPGLDRLIRVEEEFITALKRERQSALEREAVLRSLPPCDSPQSDYPYKFFSLPHAPQILDVLTKAVTDGVIQRSEFLAIIMEKGEGVARRKIQDVILQAFIKNNIILVHDVDQYVVINEAYEQYRQSTDDPVSRGAFTRKIWKTFPYRILKMIKRVNGVNAGTFVCCKLKTQTKELSLTESPPALKPTDNTAYTCKSAEKLDEQQETQIDFFVKNTFQFTENSKDRVVIAEAYRRYAKTVPEPVSRNAFTRYIKRQYAYVTEAVMRVNKIPVRVFGFCRMVEQTEVGARF